MNTNKAVFAGLGFFVLAAVVLLLVAFGCWWVFPIIGYGVGIIVVILLAALLVQSAPKGWKAVKAYWKKNWKRDLAVFLVALGIIMLLYALKCLVEMMPPCDGGCWSKPAATETVAAPTKGDDKPAVEAGAITEASFKEEVKDVEISGRKTFVVIAGEKYSPYYRFDPNLQVVIRGLQKDSHFVLDIMGKEYEFGPGLETEMPSGINARTRVRSADGKPVEVWFDVY